MAKPFLKWAGGKTKLLPELLKRVPSKYNRYYEPFLGGGALFFALKPVISYLSDINENLIMTYQNLSKYSELIFQYLQTNCDSDLTLEQLYYSFREDFNTTEYSGFLKSAQFIFLNKLGYNGLYRENSKGEFNVPFGHYKKVPNFNFGNLIQCSKLLQRSKIQCTPYYEIKATSGDFVYLDPPYYKVSEQSFTKYTRFDFAKQDHVALFDFCRELDAKGVKFMLSNSDTVFTRKLYSKFNIEIVQAPRSINSKGNGRGNVNELIIRNYD